MAYIAFFSPTDAFRNTFHTFTIEAIRTDMKSCRRGITRMGVVWTRRSISDPNGFRYVFASTSLSRYSLPAVSQKEDQRCEASFARDFTKCESFLHLTELRYIFQTYVKLPKTPTILSIAGVLRRTRPVAIGDVMWLT